MHTGNGTGRTRLKAGAAGVALLALALSATAQNYPITPEQRSTAQQVAQSGVPLSELSPTAPDTYIVKSGDTLWAISGMFLRSPWRWPELWGMNLSDIANPHRIYPGQQLYLDKINGRAYLRMGRGGPGDGGAPADVRVSPRTRYESLADLALPTLKPNLIEPFLAEPLVVEESTLGNAPRIVATRGERVLMAKGDRAYALGPDNAPLIDTRAQARNWRIFRNAVPLRDPVTQEVLGYEAQYVGKAELQRGETTQQAQGKEGEGAVERVPATIDIVAAKEEIRAGDRLLPEPPRQLVSYAPRAPEQRVDGSIVSVYGSAVTFAAQNQVVVINRGTRDGLQSGHVLAILSKGGVVRDRDVNGKRTDITLPNERNGLLMVFRPFERVSYALVLEITDGVRAGDRVTNPR